MLSLNQRALWILNYCLNPSESLNAQSKDYSNNNLFEYSNIQLNVKQFKYMSWLVYIPLISVLFSIVFTQSLLLLANNQPLNILLMLVVLVIMPWISYFLILSLKSKLSFSFPASNSNHSNILLSLIKRLSSQAAFLFALSSWICIWLNLLVQDIPLGWSSTFDLSAQQLSDLSKIISFSWNAWFESATLSEVWFIQNQFYYLQTIIKIESAQSIQGWRFLMIAELFFSILPRLIMFIVQSYKLKKEINAWIKWDWPLLQQSTKIINKQPIKSEMVIPDKAKFNVKDYDVILSWQVPLDSEFVTLLGLGSWQDDQLIMSKIANNQLLKKIIFLVDARQAPIADIADLIKELLAANAQKTIVLVINNVSNHPLREGLIFSWQNFAKQLNIQSYITDEF